MSEPENKSFGDVSAPENQDTDNLNTEPDQMSGNENKSYPPPPPDGFFGERHAKQEKSSGSGCFWAIIIGIISVLVIIIVMIGVVLVGAVATVKSTITEIGGEVNMKNNKYQETFVTGSRSSNNKIALVEVKGIITGQSSGGLSSSGASAASINSKLRHILKDKSFKALIVRIDSPGGEVTASDEIYHMLMKIRKERKIPVVASMGSLAASGGYYVACGCDKIMAHKMTTTGSIGVIIQTYKYYDMFKKIGLKGEAFTSGPMKAMLSGDKPTSEAEKVIVKKLVMNVYDDFVGIVAKGRPKLTKEIIKTTEVGDGRVFLGAQAVKNGLVDELGYFEDAVALTAKMANLSTYKVVSLNIPFSLGMLFGQMESKAAAKSVNIQLPGSPGFKMETGKIYLLPAEFAEKR